MEINENGEVAEMDNDELAVDAANEAPPSLDAMTNTTAANAEEGGEDDNGSDNIKGGEERGAFRRSDMAKTTKTMTMKRTCWT